MLYLIDPNVLITAHNLYYPVDAVPEYWSWLAHHGEQGSLKMPLEVYEELKDGSSDEERDLLFGWANDEDNKQAILFGDEVDPDLVARVVADGYAPDLSDQEVEQLGRDPFLIAYALAATEERCVVTTEVSAPSRRRQNRKIPDVCQSLGVQCCDPFAMQRALNFSTGWNRP